jgi:hypothetical protein
MLEVVQNDLDLLLGFYVDLQVVLCSSLGMLALKVLANHDERHQQNLDQVRQKQPKYESHGRIEFVLIRSQEVPAEPEDCPGEDDQKEAHRPDVTSDPQRQSVQARTPFAHFIVDVAEWRSALPKLVERNGFRFWLSDSSTSH